MQTSYFMYMYIAEDSAHQISIFGNFWEGLNLPLIRNFKDLTGCGCSPVNVIQNCVHLRYHWRFSE